MVASSIDGISPLILGICWTRQTQIIGPQLEMKSETKKRTDTAQPLTTDSFPS
jgi:hypothetical protein